MIKLTLLGRHEALRDAFIDSPQFIKDLYSEHKDTLMGILVDADVNGEQYDSVYKIIHVNAKTNPRALTHEFGHHIDIAINTANNKFINAVLKTISSINKDIKLQQTMATIMSKRSAYFNSELSDIFCSLARGDKNKEHLWGHMEHSAIYYKDDINVRAEIFANLFSIYARRDMEAIRHLENISSGIIKAFLDVTGGKKMEDNQSILEKSAEEKRFIEEPATIKSPIPPDLRSKYDEPCLKHMRSEILECH